MPFTKLTLFTVLTVMFVCAVFAGDTIKLEKFLEYDLGHPIGQLRSVPIDLGENQSKGILLVYSEDAEIDPYIGMFFFPKSTTKLKLITEHGKELWTRDLGPGMVSGIWFLPVFAFDLNQDGVTEIWLVNNSDPEHPMDHRKFVLEQMDAHIGTVVSQTPWPAVSREQSMSMQYRNFILGGYVDGAPVLVTAQGTYGPMALQGWNPDLSQRWEYKINPKEDGGSLGSHVCPIVDINNDSKDEFMWGERCVSMDTGAELFCADKENWTLHSDIVQPVLDKINNKWYIHTCRESSYDMPPRIVVCDDTGKKVWSALDHGHIDTGWAARIGENGEPIVLGVRVGEKIRTAEGERRTGIEPFTYHAFTGEEYPLPFNAYTTIPVDLNGDGIHELVRGYFEGSGDVLDRTGKILGNVGGLTAMASKFLDRPGEQILSYSHKTGKVFVWGDANAHDTQRALARYNHPFYNVNQKLTACGYNLFNLGGL
jgi:hypothetical protein